MRCNQPMVMESAARDAYQTIMDGHLAMGPIAEDFELILAGLHQRGYGIAFSSATSAFDAYFEYILQPGDEVIISPFTFHSVIYSIIRAGGVPVIIDCKLDGLADWRGLQKKVSSKTKAIVVTHIFGKPDDSVFAILGAYRGEGIKVIEDCAQAIGAKYMSGYVGSCRVDASIFSFYATKNITAVEAGVLLTDNKSTELAMKNLRNNGIVVRGDRTIFGTNRRLSDVHAAVGLADLERLEDLTDMRNEQASKYNQLLGLDPTPLPEGYRHAYHHYTILVDPKKRNDIVQHLRMKQIELGTYYRYFAHQDALVVDYIKNTYTPTLLNLAARLLQLPLGFGLSGQEKVTDSIREVYDGEIIHAA